MTLKIISIIKIYLSDSLSFSPFYFFFFLSFISFIHGLVSSILFSVFSTLLLFYLLHILFSLLFPPPSPLLNFTFHSHSLSSNLSPSLYSSPLFSSPCTPILLFPFPSSSTIYRTISCPVRVPLLKSIKLQSGSYQ